MHEMSLAMNLLAQLEELARRRDLARLTTVEVVHGELKQVVPEAFELAFETAARGTVAEGARLILTEEKLAARCSLCQTEYHPPLDDYLCPNCGEALPQWLAGHDIILKSVEAETRDPEPPAP